MLRALAAWQALFGLGWYTKLKDHKRVSDRTGILLLRKGSAEGKVAFFMSADKVKFRKPVVPGDQLIIIATLDKVRGNKLATAKVESKVGEQVVSSASLMFSIVDAGEDA